MANKGLNSNDFDSKQISNKNNLTIIPTQVHIVSAYVQTEAMSDSFACGVVTRSMRKIEAVRSIVDIDWTHDIIPYPPEKPS